MFLDNLGFTCQANLVFEDVWGGEASLPLPENYNYLESYLCGIGKNMATIGSDSKQYSCERAIPFSRDGTEAFFDLSRKILKPETCEACPFLPLCPECRAYNFEHYGDANHKTT
ncbi:MAG: hypothetical protein HGB23_10130, partial [Chlorobiaceae bacterium]|nr:hypothetical protein [Chlorobiaceae bacterium]